MVAQPQEPSRGNQTNSELTKSAKTRKRRAPSTFPRLALSKTMELIETIYKLGHGDPVRRRTVFTSLGKSPTSTSPQKF